MRALTTFLKHGADAMLVNSAQKNPRGYLKMPHVAPESLVITAVEVFKRCGKITVFLGVPENKKWWIMLGYGKI